MAYVPVLGNPKPSFFDANGDPYVGMRLFFYIAGTSTKQDTQTNSIDAVDNTNPVVIGADGYPESNVMIFAQYGLSYKVVAAPPGSDDPPTSPLWTIDNILAGNLSDLEWPISYAAIYIDADTFRVENQDVTSVFTVGRPVKLTGGADRYGIVVSASFSTHTDIDVKEITDSSGTDSTLHASMDTAYVNILGTQMPVGDLAIGVQRNLTNAELTSQHKVNEVRTISMGADYGDSLSLTNGTDDWTTVIQNAITDIKDTVEVPTSDFTKTYILKFPVGIFGISADILLYSGITIEGEGPGTRFTELGSFAGTNLFTLTGGATNYVSNVAIKDCHITTTTVPGIGQNAQVVGNSLFENIVFDCIYNMILDSYTQACIIRRIYSYSVINEKILELRGNWNLIDHVDREGGISIPGTTDPYIYIYNHALGYSTGNVLINLLLEGGTSANKSLVKLEQCDETYLDNFWFEPTTTDGYAIRILDCLHIYLGPNMHGFGDSTTKLKVDTTQLVRCEWYNADGTDSSWQTYIEVDSESTVEFAYINNRRGSDSWLMQKNIWPKQIYSRAVYTDAVTYINPMQEMHWLAGQNMAVNPSFEAGRYGWTFTTIPTTTEEYITSEVGPGLMGHFVWAAQGSHQIYQNVTVPANMPVTVTAMIKHVDGIGWAHPLTSGPGIGVTDVSGYHRGNNGQGWQVITRTVIPTSAGTLQVGIYFINTIECYVDNFSVSIGKIAVPNLAYFNTLELGGQTVTYGSAAPTTGTWKQGDIVYDSTPSASGFIGWVCVTAGSPGTWKTFGVISA